MYCTMIILCLSTKPGIHSPDCQSFRTLRGPRNGCTHQQRGPLVHMQSVVQTTLRCRQGVAAVVPGQNTWRVRHPRPDTFDAIIAAIALQYPVWGHWGAQFSDVNNNRLFWATHFFTRKITSGVTEHKFTIWDSLRQSHQLTSMLLTPCYDVIIAMLHMWYMFLLIIVGHR